MSFVEALQKSMSDSKEYLFPIIERVLDGRLIVVEGDDFNETKRLLDTLAGIDLFSANHSKGMRGVASRVQWGRAWRTFTIRKERKSGVKTEHEKRKYAIENGFLYPKITMQAYIEDDKSMVTIGIAYTEDIIKCIDDGDCYVKDTSEKQKGQASFFVVKWDDMKAKGMKLWERSFLIAA